MACFGSTRRFTKKTAIPAPSHSAAGMTLAINPMPLFCTAASTSKTGRTESAKPSALPWGSSLGSGMASSMSFKPTSKRLLATLSFSLPWANAVVANAKSVAALSKASSFASSGNCVAADRMALFMVRTPAVSVLTLLLNVWAPSRSFCSPSAVVFSPWSSLLNPRDNSVTPSRTKGLTKRLLSASSLNKATLVLTSWLPFLRLFSP